MSKPVITVIMLTYNREALVSRAIESIVGQTFTDFEYIIVNNGSSDCSGAIADEYAQKDNRIRVIHRERGNIGSGRNTGLDAARGEYIAFIDDDDWCEADFLGFLYNLAIDNDADVSICGADKIENGDVSFVGIADGEVLMDAEDAIIELMWRKRFNNGFPTKLFKRSLFDNLRFPESGRYDDIYLMYKVLAGAKNIVYHGLPKYHVYRHDGNNSSATTKDSMITPEYLRDYRAVYRERTKWLCERFPGQADYWWYFDWSFQISMVHKIVSNKHKSCKMYLTEMRRELAEHGKEFINNTHILDVEKEWMETYVDIR